MDSADLGLIRTYLGVPLVDDSGQVLGVFTLVRREVNPFNEAQIALVQSFAAQAQLAMKNARLMQQTQESLELQQASADVLGVISSSVSDTGPVFDKILQSCERLFPATVFNLHLVDEAGLLAVERIHATAAALAQFGREPLEAFHAAVGSRYPMPLAGTHAELAFSRGGLVEISDLMKDPDVPRNLRETVERTGQSGSALIAPLMWEGRGIGVILAGRPPGPFLPRERALLKTFADQAVIAIQNAKMFRETNEALERQTATADVLGVISRSMGDAAPVLDAILEKCEVLIDESVGSSITLVGDDGLVQVGHFRLNAAGKAFFDTPAAADAVVQHLRSRPPAPYAGSPMEHVVQAGRAVIYPDVVHGPDVPDSLRKVAHLLLRGRQTYAMLAVPLFKNGRGLGAISVARNRTGGFSDKEIALLQTFADQAVVAIENARLFNQTQEALAHQTASADILRVISSSPTAVQPVFEAIVGTAVKHLGCDLALVQTVSGDTYSPQAMATPAGLTPVPGAQRMPVDSAANFPSRAIRSKTMLHVPDWSAVELPPHEQVRHEQLGLNSALYLPLLRGEDCVGVLVLGSRKANAFNNKAVALAESFRDQALIAIENTRLFNETQEALERQTATAEILKVMAASPAEVQPVFDAIVRSGSSLLRDSRVVLWLLEGRCLRACANSAGTEAARALGTIDLDRTSPIGACMLDAQQLHLSDLAAAAEQYPQVRERILNLGYHSGIFTPLTHESQAIGGLAVLQPQRGAFSQEDEALLRTFADQAVIAIQNARLFNETQEALERQTATSDVLRVISSSVADAAPVFDKILESCERLFGGDQNGISLVRDDGQVYYAALRTESAERAAQLNEGFPRPLKDSYQGYVLRKGRVVYYPDIINGPKVPEAMREHGRKVGNYSLLVAPMLWEGRGIGTIHVVRMPPRPYTEKESSLLKTFADQAVIAIQNARLFRETHEALERQTATAEILAVISESPTDVQPVFQAIAERARALCKADVGATTRLDGDVVHLAGVRAQSTQAEDAMRAAFPMAVDAAPPNIRRAIVEQQPIQIADVRAEPGYSDAPKAPSAWASAASCRCRCC